MNPPNTVEVPDWALDLFPLEPLMFAHLGNYQYRHISTSLVVICSAAEYADGKRWMHVSCARRESLPSWEDLKLVKDTFIGRDRLAIQVLPPQAQYVNRHPHVLHLWACLDGDPCPDFRLPNGSI